MRQKFWHYDLNFTGSNNNKRIPVRHDNPILRKEGGGGEGCLWVGNQWSRDEKNNPDHGLFLVLGLLFFFFLFIP